MSKNENFISADEMKIQREYMKNIRLRNEGLSKTAYIVTFGCRQNETDSDKLYGCLMSMGYAKAQNDKRADIIIFNTCSVREHAEMKVYGSIGALKARKLKNPSLIIGVCGCLMQQPHASEKIKKSFSFVDMIFGTHALYKFPEMLYNVIESKRQIYEVAAENGSIAEGVPVIHEKWYKASIPIMFGCDNFCTYCVVPSVRGRERSRLSADILREISELSQKGLKEVTLLGQNVNSYGKNNSDGVDFPDLLNEISKFDSIKRIRFVTSHPKDLTDKLINVMAENKKICKSLHLPFQAGNNRILAEMNRKYTREDYLSLVDKIKKAMPDISLTSDVIVGFPSETDEEFNDTMSLIEQVRFDSLYTFIYSKRSDTKAALMADNRVYEEKLANFNKLLEKQNNISKEINDTYFGKIYEIIDEGVSKNNPEMRSGRTESNKIINYKPKNELKEGDFVKVKITQTRSWSLNGEIL